MKPDSPEFLAQFVADCMTHREHTVRLELKLSMALAVIAQLQLALRHPNNIGQVAKETREVIDQLIERVAVTETIRRGMLAGYKPQFDLSGG